MAPLLDLNVSRDGKHSRWTSDGVSLWIDDVFASFIILNFPLACAVTPDFSVTWLYVLVLPLTHTDLASDTCCLKTAF